MRVYNYGDSAYVDAVDSAESFAICDDCRQAYLDPPYYTFPTEACKESIGMVIPTPHKECTGNLCPDCAIDLEPDNENDPRRQTFIEQSGQWNSTGVKP